ncbi:MAG TPA: hypothetical protein VEA81_11575 [Burkholderiaceae bacterium]|nr:hypothetical protein [Burkholderiaceae bacterium]
MPRREEALERARTVRTTRVTALPRQRPVTRRAEARWLPSERLVGLMLVLIGLSCILVLTLGVINVVVAP